MPKDGGPPGPEWFERIAESSGLVFYVLRLQPDLAFEYLGSALLTRLGIPVNPETAVDTEAVLGRIDPESADLMAGGDRIGECRQAERKNGEKRSETG